MLARVLNDFKAIFELFNELHVQTSGSLLCFWVRIWELKQLGVDDTTNSNVVLASEVG